MKLRKILFILLIMLLSMALFACLPTRDNDIDNKNEDKVSILKDLIDYGSDGKYYNVNAVVYNDTDQQKSLLQARMEEKEEEEDLSVPLQIFINCEPEQIIAGMSRAALSYEKMDKTVNYLAGQESPDDLQSFVDSGIWEDNDDWSFFDDWDYYEKLQDRAEDSTDDNDEDNVMRQRRKIMRQIYNIGLTGDEFARLVYEEVTYAYGVTENTMYLEYVTENGLEDTYDYDTYVKEQLDYDTLVYFKAFNQFSTASKSQTVKLYGYYYDYNEAIYAATDDDTFERELTYSHLDIFTTDQWLDHLEIQRNNYTSAYRYSSEFYQQYFYPVHFQFQELLEDYDREVYGISLPSSDEQIRYTKEMKKGMDHGFAQQLTLTDHLYIYSLDDPTMTAYNKASSEFERVKEGSQIRIRNEKEHSFNMEQLKIVDYILTKMSNSELTAVLKYQIMSYSGDMLRNMQSEKKNVVLDTVEKGNIPISASDYQKRYDDLDVNIGRTEAIIAQLDRSYGNANPASQFTTANGAPWDGIREEITEALEHDYDQYSDGTEKKEALDNLIIKKKEISIESGNDYVPGVDDSALIREEYDESHRISRFLKDHETVLRYAIGQVEIQVSALPTKAGSTTFKLETQIGTFTCGNDGKGRTMPDGVMPNSHPNWLDSVTFSSGLTFNEGISEKEADRANFLSSNEGDVEIDDEEYQHPTSATKRHYRYTFEGWYIDVNLKYQIREDEKVKYDLFLYPGYTVVVQSETFSAAD